MKLYKVELTYKKGSAINIPFTYYILAESVEEAAEKTSETISLTPDDMQDWCIDTEPEEIASNDCGDSSNLLIE